MSNESDMMTTLTADIAMAYVQHNTISTTDVPVLITSIFDALTRTTSKEPPAPEYVPAVDPKKSVKSDHLISLIDGRPYKLLRRHLAMHGLTPEEYRARYGLAHDYPMVARNYAEQRRQLAKDMGLGTARNRKG